MSVKEREKETEGMKERKRVCASEKESVCVKERKRKSMRV